MVIWPCRGGGIKHVWEEEKEKRNRPAGVSI